MFYVLYSSLLSGGGVHTELGLKMLVDLLTFVFSLCNKQTHKSHFLSKSKQPQSIIIF